MLINLLRSLFCRTYRTHTLLLWRSLCHLSRFLLCHARRPRDDELDRQVITSGPMLWHIPPPLLHPRFRIVPYDIHPTHLRLWLYFFSSFSPAYPLSVNSTLLAVLYRSHKLSPHVFSSHILLLHAQNVLPLLHLFPLHVQFLYLFHVRPRHSLSPFLQMTTTIVPFFHLHVPRMLSTYIVPQYI